MKQNEVSSCNADQLIAYLMLIQIKACNPAILDLRTYFHKNDMLPNQISS